MVLDYSICVGICCKNSSEGLPHILKNLERMAAIFSKMSVIFCHDDSQDNTIEILENAKKQLEHVFSIDIIPNKYEFTNSRTANISNARNTILELIREKYVAYDFFANMDSNNYSCIGEMNLNILEEVFAVKNFEKWDSVSFDREAGYYDHWALSFPNFIYSFFHCADWHRIVDNLRRDFGTLIDGYKQINPDGFIPVFSAFNGFAIYKMAKFINCSYSSSINLDLFPLIELENQKTYNSCQIVNNFNDDCEHRKFHLESIKKYKSKIRIYPKSLFKSQKVELSCKDIKNESINLHNMNTYNTKYGKITLYANEIYIAGSFNKGVYWDEETLLKLREYVNPDRNVLEIGGHCGTSTIVYSHFLNPDKKIYVYEPQENMYNLLVHNVIQNNLQHKILPRNLGVFCYDGVGKMNDIDLDGGGGLVARRYNEEINYGCNFGGIGLGKSGETVNLTTIDSMNLENIGFIHCDAQGSENFIFSKSIETIKKCRPVILYENNAEHAQYLYNNVCNSYPEYQAESKFDVKKFCMEELNYSQCIDKFNGSIDSLLIP
jgi:FkbM family methyltransferase